MSTRKPLKKYIVRKTVYAISVYDALRKEKDKNVDDCYLDENWSREGAIEGFRSGK